LAGKKIFPALQNIKSLKQNIFKLRALLNVRALARKKVLQDVKLWIKNIYRNTEHTVKALAGKKITGLI